MGEPETSEDYRNAEVGGEAGVAEVAGAEAVREVAVRSGHGGVAAVDGREARRLGGVGDCIFAEAVADHGCIVIGEIEEVVDGELHLLRRLLRELAGHVAVVTPANEVLRRLHLV